VTFALGVRRNVLGVHTEARAQMAIAGRAGLFVAAIHQLHDLSRTVVDGSFTDGASRRVAQGAERVIQNLEDEREPH
jgi:hypothetical protein